jgi:OFA family oxalate/formate antiporter-like MFS transporter
MRLGRTGIRTAPAGGYGVILASVIIQAALGGVFAWSVFVPPLREAFGLTAGQAGSIFGLSIASFTVSMVFSGRLQDAKGPRLVAALGALLFASGYLIASVSGGAFPILLLGMGLLTGVGIGFGYVGPLATCIKWFPDRKGLVTGVAVAGFGGGAIFLSALTEYLLGRGMGVLEIFRWVGLAYGTLVLVSAMFLRLPPQAGVDTPLVRTPAEQLLRQRDFLALLTGMFSGTFGGLLVVGNLKPMGLVAGLTEPQAVSAVGVFAAANALGRIFWGVVYDRIGRTSVLFKLVLLAGGVSLISSAHTTWIFMTATAMVGTAFGGCFVLYAAQVAGIYGHERVGSVYPMVFLAYGVAGLLAPAGGGFILDISGSYLGANAVSVLIAVSGALVVRLLWRKGTR